MARKRDVVARTLPIVIALAFALATLNTSNQLSALREEHGKLTQLHRIASNDLVQADGRPAATASKRWTSWR